jgi:DNA-binding XRE family transcriptional regulator
MRTETCHNGKTGRMSEEIEYVLEAMGPRLRALRRQRGVTLAELAAKTGISESTLSRLESGRRRGGPGAAAAAVAPTTSRSTTSSARRAPETRGSTCTRSTATE